MYVQHIFSLPLEALAAANLKGVKHVSSFDSVMASCRNRMVSCWASWFWILFTTISKHIVIQPVVLCPGSDFYQMMDAYHVHLRKASSRHVLQVVRLCCFESIGTRPKDALKHCRMAPIVNVGQECHPCGCSATGGWASLMPRRPHLFWLLDVIMVARCISVTGNHHPVAPPGATPFQMASVASSSLFVVRLKARQGWTFPYDEDGCATKV